MEGQAGPDEARKKNTKQLQSMWEFASVIAFLDTFEEVLKVKSFQPWELEVALVESEFVGAEHRRAKDSATTKTHDAASSGAEVNGGAVKEEAERGAEKTHDNGHSEASDSPATEAGTSNGGAHHKEDEVEKTNSEANGGAGDSDAVAMEKEDIEEGESEPKKDNKRKESLDESAQKNGGKGTKKPRRGGKEDSDGEYSEKEEEPEEDEEDEEEEEEEEEEEDSEEEKESNKRRSKRLRNNKKEKEDHGRRGRGQRQRRGKRSESEDEDEDEDKEEQRNKNSNKKRKGRDENPSYQYLAGLHITLLKNIAGRGSSLLTMERWEGYLRRELDKHWDETMEALFGASNPLEDSPYVALSLQTKVLILKVLCDLQLDGNPALLAEIHSMESKGEFARLHPVALGRDGRGRLYWHFSGGRRPYLYREKQPLMEDDRLTIITPGKWKTVCRTLAEMEALADGLMEGKSKRARQLSTTIMHDVVPPLFARELEEQKAAQRKARSRKAGIDTSNVINDRSRRARKAVNYAYDSKELDKAIKQYNQARDSSDDDDGENDEEADDKRSGGRGTRSSTRIQKHFEQPEGFW